MRYAHVMLLAAVTLITAPACDTPLGPDIVRVAGTVRFYTFEGGFWAVRGDDATTYDPIGGLPPDFRQDSLRVFLHARVRSDMSSFHMVGPIVEIISIRRP